MSLTSFIKRASEKSSPSDVSSSEQDQINRIKSDEMSLCDSGAVDTDVEVLNVEEMDISHSGSTSENVDDCRVVIESCASSRCNSEPHHSSDVKSELGHAGIPNSSGTEDNTDSGIRNEETADAGIRNKDEIKNEAADARVKHEVPEAGIRNETTTLEVRMETEESESDALNKNEINLEVDAVSERIICDEDDPNVGEGRKAVRLQADINEIARRLQRLRNRSKNSGDKKKPIVKFYADIDPSSNKNAEQELSREISKDMFAKVNFLLIILLVLSFFSIFLSFLTTDGDCGAVQLGLYCYTPRKRSFHC